MYETEFQKYKAQRTQVRDQYQLNFLLNENVKIEGPTFSNSRNMLKSEDTYGNNHVIELYDWMITNMWESNGKLGHMTIELYDLGHKGIGDVDH